MAAWPLRAAPRALPPAEGLAQDLPAEDLSIQASKNRRSADSRSSPTTMPTFFQRRRPKVKRRNVAASNPMSSAKSTPAMAITVADAPIKRRPTCSARATMT